MDNRVEKVKALLNDEAFLEQTKDVASMEELQAAFKQNGVELSLAQVEGLVQAAYESVPAASDELDAGQLDSVSGGGIKLKNAWKICCAAFKKGWEWGNKFYEWEQSWS